jgi:hypothetical protein
VVIHNLNISCLVARPFEADTPLIVDTNAVFKPNGARVIPVIVRDAVLARFRVVRLVMQNQKNSLINIVAIKFYPSRLSRKDLLALFMKEQAI